MNKTDCDVIVIGAGPSGLRAALELSKHQITVKVLEARDRVGGRTYTQLYPKYEHDPKNKEKIYVDIGGQWVGPTQTYVMDLIKHYNLKLHPQFDEGKHVLEVNGNVFEYKGNISELATFSKPVDIKNKTDDGKGTIAKPSVDAIDTDESKPELDRVWAKLDELCFSIDLQNPTNNPNSYRWDHMTFETWTRDNIKNESTRILVNWFVQACFAAEPSEISFLSFLMFLRAGGGYTPLVNIHGGAQEQTLVGGSQQLSECMQKDIDKGKTGSNVLLNHPVVAVKQDTNTNTTSVVYIKKKNSKGVDEYGILRCKYCIIAMSPNFTQRIQFSPPLPPLRDQLSQRFHSGCVIKVNIFYEKSFWRETGFSGELISDIGPISIAYDKTYDNCTGIVGFMVGSVARKWSLKTREERKRAVCDQLVRIFKNEKARNPIQYVEHDWTTEEYSRGCYFSVATTGALSECGEFLRKPCGMIHWAGTETAFQWIGYIDGALESGIRSAKEIIQKMASSKQSSKL